MKSKGTQTMQKIVIKKPWGVEIKDYKAGDPIPAGVKFKIFDAKDTAKIEAYADSLDESADYQKNRFKEPAYMYNESAKITENKMVGIISLPVGSKFIDDSFGGKRTLEVVKHGNDDIVHVREVGTGRKFAYDASTPGGNKKVEKIEEGRIAKGYENLDADEKARHLLSHPTSKYMSDLKSENITERAIRKAVKEMLGKPDKRDPQFIIDVNEEGEAPAATTTTANVANPELPLKLKESIGQKLNISLVRKPLNMKEVEKAIRKGEADRVKAVVDKSYKLSENEYDKFVYNFMVHTTYLKGEGGVDSDGTVHVIEITAPARKTIYVDPEGYDYARYVGF